MTRQSDSWEYQLAWQPRAVGDLYVVRAVSKGGQRLTWDLWGDIPTFLTPTRQTVLGRLWSASLEAMERSTSRD